MCQETSMLDHSTLTAALKSVLPLSQQIHAPTLATLILTAIADPAVSAQGADPILTRALSTLIAQPQLIMVGGTALSFGQGNDQRDARIVVSGHVAGGSIVQGPITVHITLIDGDYVEGDTVRGDKYVAPASLSSLASTRRIPFMAPAPPEDFVARPREYELILSALLDPSHYDSVGVTTALRGAGGFGKTTLVKALCYDERVQAAFPDGIIWVMLQEHPGELIGRVQDVIAALSGERPAFALIDSAISHLVALLDDRRCLIVIDDVWNEAHLVPFCAGGPRSVRLITTRHHQALPPKTRTVPVDAMQVNEAIALLQIGLSDLPSNAAMHLATRLGEWPVLLRLVNRAIREYFAFGMPAVTAIASIHEGLDEVGLTAFDIANPQSRDQAVAATIQISLSFLEQAEQLRYGELAIFPEDAVIPLQTIARFWNATGTLSFFQTQRLCMRLAQLSLLLDYNAASQTIVIHDVMRSYLLHIHHVRLIEMHQQFLHAHQPPSLSWSDLSSDDPYLWHMLGYHLVAANRAADLRMLLLDPVWLEKMLTICGVNALVATYGYLPDDPALGTIQSALRLASHILDRDPHQLASQLCGRLSDQSDATIHHLCAVIDRDPPYDMLVPRMTSLAPPGRGRYRVLVGHTDSILAVAAFPDNRRVITGSSDGSLIIWDLEHETIHHHIQAQHKGVYAVAVTPDGKTAISGHGDGTIRTWDVETGTPLHTIAELRGMPSALVITRDGRRVLASYKRLTSQPSCPLLFWNIATGQRLQLLEGHTESVTRLSLTRDGRRAISGSENGEIIVWNLQRARPHRTLRFHSVEITAITVLPNQHDVLSADKAGNVYHWNMYTGMLHQRLAPTRLEVRALMSDLSGNQITGIVLNGSFVQWDLSSSGNARHQQGAHELVWDAVITPNHQWRLLGVGSTLELWHHDAHMHSESMRQQGHSGIITALILTPDATRSITAGNDQTIRIWSCPEGILQDTWHLDSAWISALCLTPDAFYVVGGDREGVISIWELATGVCVRILRGHADKVNALVISPDGQTLYSASEDQQVFIWDIATGQHMGRLSAHGEAVQALALSSDGRLLATGAGRFLDIPPSEDASDDMRSLQEPYRSQDNTICLWDVATRTHIATFSGHQRRVTALAFTSNGQQLISGSVDTCIHVWDIARQSLQTTLRVHTDTVHALAVLPSNQYVVSASSDHSIRLWDRETSRIVASFNDDAGINACGVANDGSTVVAGGQSGMLHMLKVVNTQSPKSS